MALAEAELQSAWGQCGGKDPSGAPWVGPTECPQGYTCQSFGNPDYFQCWQPQCGDSVHAGNDPDPEHAGNDPDPVHAGNDPDPVHARSNRDRFHKICDPPTQQKFSLHIAGIAALGGGSFSGTLAASVLGLAIVGFGVVAWRRAKSRLASAAQDCDLLYVAVKE